MKNFALKYDIFSEGNSNKAEKQHTKTHWNREFTYPIFNIKLSKAEPSLELINYFLLTVAF